MILAVLTVFFVTGIFILSVPAVNEDLSDFSATQAMTYLKEIAKEPHSVFHPEAHERVRLYLKSTLEGFGYTPTEYDWTPAEHQFKDNITHEGIVTEEQPVAYTVRDLLVKIPGESDTGMLLMAHYDSRGHAKRPGEDNKSNGAADDGYGGATLLEIARVYQGKTGLKNSLYLLFTDAEETGMYGADLFVHSEKSRHHMANVNFVANVEARGVKGPLYMFETSTKNQKVLELYSKAQMPFAYSLATAVYTVMPNFTDFSVTLDAGKPGINFSVLDSLYYYHSEEDNLNNVNANSIQHYGTQLMPILKEYTENAKYSDPNYFQAEQDSVFFNVLPGVMAVYSETFAYVLAASVTVIFAAALYTSLKKGKFTWKDFGVQTGIAFALLLACAVFGLLVSLLMAVLGGVPWNVSYVRVSFGWVGFVLCLIGVIVGIFAYGWKKLRKDEAKCNAFFAGSLVICLLLGLVTTFVLSGASFLFVWPAFFGSIAIFVKNFTDNVYLNHVCLSINLAVALLFHVPLVYSLYIALSVGVMVAVNFILALPLLVCVPVLFLQNKLEKPCNERH